jgi:hypothetical protein
MLEVLFGHPLGPFWRITGSKLPTADVLKGDALSLIASSLKPGGHDDAEEADYPTARRREG